MSLKGVAKETLKILEDGGFTAPSGEWVELRAELDQAVEKTRLYTPVDLEALVALEETQEGTGPRIEVNGDTTQVAAHRLVVDEGIDDLVLLNFASARNAGGGFITGAKAQEEDLTRCSGLYPCLLTQQTYYQVNRS